MLLCGISRSGRGVNDLRRGWTQNVVDNVARSRRLERRYRRTQSAADRQAWFNRSEHGTSYRQRESVYWSAEITSQAGQSKRLWHTFKSILGGEIRESLPKNHPSAQRFLDFFSEKVEAVHHSTTGGTVQSMLRLMCHLTRSCAAPSTTSNEQSRQHPSIVQVLCPRSTAVYLYETVSAGTFTVFDRSVQLVTHAGLSSSQPTSRYNPTTVKEGRH